MHRAPIFEPVLDTPTPTRVHKGRRHPIDIKRQRNFGLMQKTEYLPPVLWLDVGNHDLLQTILDASVTHPPYLFACLFKLHFSAQKDFNHRGVRPRVQRRWQRGEAATSRQGHGQ
jgi:hypothetical protein